MLLSVPWYQRMLLSNKYPEVKLALAENARSFGLDTHVLHNLVHHLERLDWPLQGSVAKDKIIPPLVVDGSTE